MIQYFPEPYERSTGNVKTELDLSNYATKTNLKGRTVIDTSIVTSKTDVTEQKAEIYQLDVDKLKTVTDIDELSNVVHKDVVKIAYMIN